MSETSCSNEDRHGPDAGVTGDFADGNSPIDTDVIKGRFALLILLLMDLTLDVLTGWRCDGRRNQRR